MNNTIYFVCGTPSNKQGFQCASEFDADLPGEPAEYLDRVDYDRLTEHDYGQVRTIDIKHVRYTLLVFYRAIEPNDTHGNRGAYIAVGCITDKSIKHDNGVSIIARLSMIQEFLQLMRRNGNQFPSNFKLDSLLWEDFPVQTCLLRNTKLLVQASTGVGAFTSPHVVECSADPDTDFESGIFGEYEEQLQRLESDNQSLEIMLQDVRNISNQLVHDQQNLAKENGYLKQVLSATYQPHKLQPNIPQENQAVAVVRPTEDELTKRIPKSLSSQRNSSRSRNGSKKSKKYTSIILACLSFALLGIIGYVLLQFHFFGTPNNNASSESGTKKYGSVNTEGNSALNYENTISERALSAHPFEHSVPNKPTNEQFTDTEPAHPKAQARQKSGSDVVKKRNQTLGTNR